VIVPVVIRASSRFLTQSAALFVASTVGVAVYSMWGTPDSWPVVLQEVAGLFAVAAGVTVAVFGGMWLWYGSCTVTLNTDQVVLSRWGRTQFLAVWADIDAIVLYTHVPKRFPRLEVITRTGAPTSSGRHSGAIKATLPLLLTLPQSDDAANTLLEECARHGIRAEHRAVDERARWFSHRLQRLIRSARKSAHRRPAPLAIPTTEEPRVQ
jgi:hypothetical protein